MPEPESIGDYAVVSCRPSPQPYQDADMNSLIFHCSGLSARLHVKNTCLLKNISLETSIRPKIYYSIYYYLKHFVSSFCPSHCFLFHFTKLSSLIWYFNLFFFFHCPSFHLHVFSVFAHSLSLAQHLLLFYALTCPVSRKEKVVVRFLWQLLQCSWNRVFCLLSHQLSAMLFAKGDGVATWAAETCIRCCFVNQRTKEIEFLVKATFTWRSTKQPFLQLSQHHKNLGSITNY